MGLSRGPEAGNIRPSEHGAAKPLPLQEHPFAHPQTIPPGEHLEQHKLPHSVEHNHLTGAGQEAASQVHEFKKLIEQRGLGRPAGGGGQGPEVQNHHLPQVEIGHFGHN